MDNLEKRIAVLEEAVLFLLERADTSDEEYCDSNLWRLRSLIITKGGD